MPHPSIEPDLPRLSAADDFGSIEADLPKWLDVIQADNERFRRWASPAAVAGWILATRLLSSPRVLRQALNGRPRLESDRSLQHPWLPRWPCLEAKPLHDQHSYPWAEILRQASADIRNELWQVCDMFSRSQYQSDSRGEKHWSTYLFYSRCRPQQQHLEACPRTREALAQIPHNSLLVAFSALEPGGALTPHTGPTNASLTAHLGLVNCEKTRLWAGGQTAQYRDDQVLVFDDSFVHWVHNDGTERRYSLMITFWHPELSALERQWMYGAIRTFG